MNDRVSLRRERQLAERVRAEDARVGTLLDGKWELRRRIGTGAMASVYLGIHRNGSRVAIKILHPLLAHKHELLRRFLREGHLANKVEHPGIVRVLDDGVAPDGAPFLVMELIDGPSLSELLAREGPFDARRAALVGVKILDALAATHGKGIVHRDLKPANVSLCNDGTVKVLDFGIARLRDSMPLPPLTVEGSVMGTPAFMPPEQALGSIDHVDARTDVWAVGATLYMLLTGRSVRDEAADANEALLLAMWKPVSPVAALRPELPRALSAVIDRALLLDRSARWPSALAMKASLEHAMVGGRAMLAGCITQRGIAPNPSDGVTCTDGPMVRTSPLLRDARALDAGAPRSPLPLFTGPRPRPVSPLTLPIRFLRPTSLVAINESAHPSKATPARMAMHRRRSRLATSAGVAMLIAVVGLTGTFVALAFEDDEDQKRKMSSAEGGTASTMASTASASAPPEPCELACATPAPSASALAPRSSRPPASLPIQGTETRARSDALRPTRPRNHLDLGRF